MSFTLEAAAPNIFPSKYRQVSVNDEGVDVDIESLRRHFVGREAYNRTRFIVVRSPRHLDAVSAALIEVETGPGDDLFLPITNVRVLADQAECVYREEPDVDVGIPSHMATLLPLATGTRCLIVEGRYSHVSFLLNPAPLHINVLDIVPPAPSKLFDQLQRVLDTAEDTPPVVLSVESVDSGDLLDRSAEAPANVLLPCRGPGVTLGGAGVSYLDQRPEKADWTLLGCQRSMQIHQWFYDEEAPSVDTCPRQFLGEDRDGNGATLTRCCLLQQGMEVQGRAVLIPWGSSLAEVRAALDRLIESEELTWTPT